MNLTDYHREIQVELEETHRSCLGLLKTLLGTPFGPVPITYRALFSRGTFSMDPLHIYIGKPDVDELQLYMNEALYEDWRASLQFTCAHETGHYAHASINPSFFNKINRKKRSLADMIAEITALHFLDVHGTLDFYISRTQQKESKCYYNHTVLELYRASSNQMDLLWELMAGRKK